MSYEYARYRTPIFFWLGATRMQHGATLDCRLLFRVKPQMVGGVAWRGMSNAFEKRVCHL